MTAISALSASRVAMHKRRKRVNTMALTLAFGAMAFGVFWLIWILFETIRLGVGGLSLSLFSEMTPPPQAETGEAIADVAPQLTAHHVAVHEHDWPAVFGSGCFVMDGSGTSVDRRHRGLLLRDGHLQTGCLFVSYQQVVWKARDALRRSAPRRPATR